MMLTRSFLALVLAGCTAATQHPVSVTLVVDGDRSGAALDRHAVAGLDLVALELPSPPPRPPDEASPLISHARTAYAHGEFTACRDDLAKIEVAHVLAAGERNLAARVLTFDAACAWGALQKTEARATANRIASLGLELPDAAVSPDVEAMIGDVIAQLGKQARHPLSITGEPGARLVVDGRAAGCALPCTVDLPPGDHVLAVDADGFAPALRTVRTPDIKNVALAQQPASRELASQHWRARIGRGMPPTDAVGVTLLAKYATESRVAYIRAGTQLAGTMIVDGTARATALRPRGEAAQLVRDLAYDGGVLPRPRVWQRPWFWIAISGAALVVAGAIVYVTYQPNVETALVW